MPRLQDQLDRITERTRALVPPERLGPSERAIEELFATGIERGILPAGAIAPAFALKDANGRIVRSADLLALGPLIVKFFRGRWCPYCIAELQAWRDAYPRVRAKGALLAAISPQSVHQTSLMQQQHPMPFPVLGDEKSAVAEQFRLAYSVPPAQQQHYRSILVNLPFVNGDPDWRLPLPATYVVRPTGEIAYAAAHADFRVRPEPDEVLATL